MRENIKKTFLLLLPLLGLAAMSHALTVTVGNDVGAIGNLRWAIANTPDGGTIDFGVTGVIILDAPLSITRTVTIIAAPSQTIFLIAASSSTDILDITANNCVISGLGFGGANRAIRFQGSPGVDTLTVENCRIGIRWDDTVSANQCGIVVGLGGLVNIRSNVISGNGYGMYLQDSYGISIYNNLIGLDSTGQLARANNYGLYLNGCYSCHIGLSTTQGNVISANAAYNIQFVNQCHDNTVFGNVIGLRQNTNDVSWLAPAVPGISVDGYHNIIGKPNAGGTSYYNIIANNSYGIQLLNGSHGNTIQANYIGINTASATAGNTQGIVIDSSYGNLIGGNRTANGDEGNIIGASGINVSIVSGEGNTVCGNYIGTDKNGTDIGSGGTYSVGVDSAHNLIGGPNLDASHQYGNYIAATQVYISPGATGTVFQGNFLGVHPVNKSQIAGYANLYIFGAQNCLIGGSSNIYRNYFCNGEPGITLIGSSTNNDVFNNWINVLPNGTSPAAPMAVGISLEGSAASNFIGQNMVAYTTTAGISGSGSTVVKDDFYGNTICTFSGTGISLVSGANNNKAAPTIASAGPFTVAGTSLANDTIELFLSDRQAGLAGGSLRHVGYCTADGTGNWAYPVTAGDGVIDGTVITGLATDVGYNTSSFASNVMFHGPTPTPTSTISPTATITCTQTPTATNTAGIQAADLAGRRVLAFPNPGRDRIKFAVALEQAGDVKIEVYNLLGERVTELAENSLPAGVNVLNWNCENISPGIYVARVFSGSAKIATVKVGIAK